MMNNRIEDVNNMDLNELKEAARKARQARPEGPQRASGCGRAYVFVGYRALRKNGRAAKALEEAGFIVTPKPGDKGFFIYAGYDNATGYELALAEAIAASFRESGIAAGVFADGD